MSDLAFVNDVTRSDGAHDCSEVPIAERTPWRVAEIAPGVTVERALPLRTRRTVGAWCFLDLAGPFDPAHGVPMDIGPHPHIGLQTVTWLFDGEVMHRDSVGSVQTVRSGELNLMTSGRGVVHSEHSPADVNGTGVHLAQLWIALPESARHGAATFEHHEQLPIVDHEGVRAQVIIGEHAGVRSPATAFTPIVGLDITIEGGSAADLPVDDAFEHAAIVIEGEVVIAGEALARGELLYLGRHRQHVAVEASADAHVMLLGGEPFESEIVMWWNFVGRTREEIAEARSAWMSAAGFEDTGGDAQAAASRFPQLDDDPSPAIAAPPLPWS